jgi:hypothetical protein
MMTKKIMKYSRPNVEYTTAGITGAPAEVSHKLRDLAHALRVNLEIDMRDQGSWYLVALERTCPNPGAGAVMLQALHILADRNCARIGLRAGDPLKPSNAKLIRYYQAFGYEIRHGNNMVRLPRSEWPKAVCHA